MDIENQEAPQAETIDRRAMLEEQLEAAERGEPIEAKTRDESGRFAKPEPQPEVEDEEPPVWRRPPASWKKDYHDVWQKADPKMQDYAWQREEQMRAGVEPLLAKAQFADTMQETIAPYLPTIQGMGLTPEKAVSALMQADYTLRTAPPQQKMQLFAQLAQSYGINLGAMGANPQAAPAPRARFTPLWFSTRLKEKHHGTSNQHQCIVAQFAACSKQLAKCRHHRNAAPVVRHAHQQCQGRRSRPRHFGALHVANQRPQSGRTHRQRRHLVDANG